MLKNNFNIALRMLVKQRAFTFINVTGLAVGIACFLLIFLYVKNEFSYDSMHAQKDQLYRITSTFTFGGETSTRASTGHPQPLAYKEDVPEIEEIVRLDADIAVVEQGREYIEQRNVVYADAALFEVFDFEVVDGILPESFEQLNQVIITEEMALKYFGEKTVAGKSIRMNVEDELENFDILAVIKDHPGNSSFNFEMVLPWAKGLRQIPVRRQNSWENISIQCFVKLTPGADAQLVAEKMEAAKAARNPGDQGSFARSIGNNLQALSDIHLNADIPGSDGLGQPALASDSYWLSAIALIILLVACINFANLSIGRALPRAKEVGVRKVLGAHKKQLAAQFLVEAFLMSFGALVLGLILAEIALPVFSNLTYREIGFGSLDYITAVSFCFGIVMLTALLAGLYPAWVISNFDTITSLKGKMRLGGKVWVSKVLVVLQFAVAVVLIVGAMGMNRQIDYMVNKDLGYDDERLIAIQTMGSGVDNVGELFENALSSSPAITGVASTDAYNYRTAVNYEDKDFLTRVCDSEANYLELLGLELLEGRLLKPGEDFYYGTTDTLTNVLVNEAFVREAGIENPVGTKTRRFRVVGVVKDYHFQSVQVPVLPLAFISRSEANGKEFRQVMVKYEAGFGPKVLSILEEKWSEVVPDRPFEASMVAELNAQRYEEETRWRSIIGYASSLAIIISVLGLLGLAQLATQQRTKEIGIRKVLGATFSHIVLLLNAGFSRLILVATLIATPVAWYAIQLWLEGFASRVQMGALIFIIPAVAVFGVAFITVSLQSLKSVNTNPVKSIRYE